VKKKSDLPVENVKDVNTDASSVGLKQGGSVPKWRQRPGAFEKPGQHRPAIPVGFSRPPSLEEQIVRVVRSQMSKQTIRDRALELDPDFEDLDKDLDRPFSPHELVHDEQLGEMTNWEKLAVDRERKAFDEKAKAYLERRKARAAH